MYNYLCIYKQCGLFDHYTLYIRLRGVWLGTSSKKPLVVFFGFARIEVHLCFWWHVQKKDVHMPIAHRLEHVMYLCLNKAHVTFWTRHRWHSCENLRGNLWSTAQLHKYPYEMKSWNQCFENNSVSIDLERLFEKKALNWGMNEMSCIIPCFFMRIPMIFFADDVFFCFSQILCPSSYFS